MARSLSMPPVVRDLVYFSATMTPFIYMASRFSGDDIAKIIAAGITAATLKWIEVIAKMRAEDKEASKHACSWKRK